MKRRINLLYHSKNQTNFLKTENINTKFKQMVEVDFHNKEVKITFIFVDK